MRNLNNFPEDIFEFSGKRLMAFAIGFTILGGAIGGLVSHQLVRRDLLADQISFERTVQVPKPDVAYASPEVVAKEWQYPQVITSGAYSSGDEYDTNTTTTDDYQKVWKFYANKTDYASMVRGSNLAHGADDNASVSSSDGQISRSVRNCNQDKIRYSQFNREDPDHFVRVTLFPVENRVLISTFVYRKPAK